MRTVSEITSYGMCVGCGACASVCPEHAITMKQNSETGLFTSAVDHLACTECGRCQAVCPAINWSNDAHGELSHPALGNYVNCYSAFSADNRLRVGAASGGFVTTLLLSLLKGGDIQGAVVTGRVRGDPFRAQTIFARTPDEIESCKGSVYSPVCFSEVFEQLKRLSENERWAIVGLPCHTQALTLMMSKHPSLRQKICLSVSLVCGHVPTHHAYDYSLKRMGSNAAQVVDIHNRGDGWPGFLRFELKDGSVKRVPHTSWLSWGMVFSSPLFTPKACHVCPDPGGFASDIMVCDAWLPRYENNIEGINLALAKTARGDDAIQKARIRGEIHLENCQIRDFIAANKRVFVAKTRNHATGMKFLLGRNAKLFHKNIQPDESNMPILTRLRLWCYYLHVKVAEIIRLDRIASSLPKAFLFYWKFVALLKR